MVISLFLISIFMIGCIQEESSTTEIAKIPTATPPTAKWIADGIVNEGEYSNNLGLSDGKVAIYWKNDDQNLNMALVGKTDGWVAIGFEPTVWMKDSDIIVGMVIGEMAEVQDQYSTGNYGPHLPDEELGGTDDILQFSGREEGGYTVIEFSRKMDTGDIYDKAFESGQSADIIWSMSDEDSFTVRHREEGKGKLTFE